MKKVLIFIALFFILHQLQAQTSPAFWQEIVSFKKKDSAQMPPNNAILFVGSSSFARWQDVGDQFPGFTIINRGFGGSTLPDVIRYTYDIILPYQPKQVVIYSGENDLASTDSVSAIEVVNRFKTLFCMIRTNLPNANIAFISMKPSPSRANVQDKMKAGNKMIKAFIDKQKNASFINIYDAMLNFNGQMREELFIKDRLHMNSEGYAIWQKAILPYLHK